MAILSLVVLRQKGRHNNAVLDEPQVLSVKLELTQILEDLEIIEALSLDLAPLFKSISNQAIGLEALLGPRGAGIGSNSWAISGELTNTGEPLLANDTHLGVQMPSIWYEIGLHCAPQGEKCPYNVTGFSFAGDPGVVIGHNDRIAWGLTNVGPDVQDLYIERINPDNPNQYEVNGDWGRRSKPVLPRSPLHHIA